MASRTSSRLSLALVWAGGIAALAGAWAGCTTEKSSSSSGAYPYASTSSGSGGAGGGGGGKDAGVSAMTARDLFALAEPELMSVCGPCHQAGGAADAPFLSAPDRYASIASWPGIIVKTASQSILVTHANDPSHGGGQAPSIPPSLQPKIDAWLEKEAVDLPSPEDDAGPSVPPFKPRLGGALNTVYLDPLGPDYENVSVSFFATELGDDPAHPSMLLLSALAVHPLAGKPVHIAHPLLTVYAKGSPPDPDPVDSFSNLDHTFAIDTDPTLGTGELVLTNWHKDAYLGIAFGGLGTEGGGSASGATSCKDLTTFTQDVVPALQYCADTCHGGKNMKANATMDLSKLGDVTPKDACLQVRAHILPGDTVKSPVLVVTDPTQQAVHMYKFFGNVANYQAFKAKVAPWIEAEK